LTLNEPLRGWLETASRSVVVVPVSPGVAAKVAELPPGFHGDPADRLIVATALELGLSLVTRDKLIRKSGAVSIMALPG
jgi:PIN domain nuclease of toxin-antitoxin system